MTASPLTSASRAPTNRDENWKYANLRALSKISFDAAVDERTTVPIAADLPASTTACRLVLIDGQYSASLSDALPSGTELSIDTRSAEVETDESVDHHYLNLNRQGRRQTLRLHVMQNQIVQLEILHVATRVGQPAIEVQIESGAELTLTERHIALGTATAATNLALDIQLAEHAKLHLARWQHFASPATYIETLNLGLGASSECDLTQITSADRSDTVVSSRSTVFVKHAGEGAQLHWNSAVIADGQQQHDAYVRIDHQARRAQTHQLFRGIASGRSKIGFNGHMLVGPSAYGTHSGQSLKTLLAGSEAEANVRPQLEIYTNEVTATHGATVGKLDGDMLFYLLSRGIDPDTAKSLLKWAFVSDVLTHLPSAELRHQIEASLVRQLPGAMAARESSTQETAR
jgi:Fe-S cluster assembly protein SufD